MFFRFFIFICVAVIPLGASAQGFTRDIEFPVDGPVNFRDDFSADRDNGARDHEGIDIIADHMTPVVSATDGTVTFITIPEASWGNAIFIKDDEGYRYWYIHLNNDTPGTDDGNAELTDIFAPGISRGARVSRGQHISYVGDSGNAESTVHHLHFELHLPDGTPVNPYESLVNASQQGRYDVQRVLENSKTINEDKALYLPDAVFCSPNTLIKSLSSDAVYYCGNDGFRYVFPNQKIYNSWYDDFNSVVTVSEEELAAAKLGGNVTYRPGSTLVKITTDPKVYAVDTGGILRWVTSEEIAENLYGTDWKDRVEDVPDTFFIDYRIGKAITSI